MEKQEFDAFISKKGLKLTRERDEIVSEVLCCQGHFAPDELFVQLRSKGSKVSRASIYRTIPLLVESGLIAGGEDGQACALREGLEELSPRPHDLHRLREGDRILLEAPRTAPGESL
jgi:Fe2+ or Zn2+ uptake regulation protein